MSEELIGFATGFMIGLVVTFMFAHYGIITPMIESPEIMNQLAHYKCQEMTYEVSYEKELCCYNNTIPECITCHKIEWQNFTTGRFLPDENKIECIYLPEYIKPNEDFTWCYDSVHDYHGQCYTILKSKKFTLEELGLHE